MLHIRCSCTEGMYQQKLTADDNGRLAGFAKLAPDKLSAGSSLSLMSCHLVKEIIIKAEGWELLYDMLGCLSLSR
jgi:hypothetical protein